MKKMNDVDEMIQFLTNELKNVEKRATEPVVRYVNSELPTIAKLLTFDQTIINSLSDEKKKKYSKFIDQNSNTISTATALGLGASILGTSGMIGTAAVSANVGLGMVGAGVLGGVAGLAFPLGIAPIFIGVISYNMLSKKVKKVINKKTIEEQMESLKVLKHRCDVQISIVSEKIEKTSAELNNVFEKELKKAMEKAKEESKKISILIDDTIHSDENLRIGQYQEIVLKQYKKQAEMELYVNQIIAKYNDLKKKNERLTRELDQYLAIKRNSELTEGFIE